MAVGLQTRTNDGVIGTSGAPVIVYGVNIIDTGSATTIRLHDGTSTGGAIRVQEVTTAGVPLTKVYADEGLMFAKGCYINTGAQTTQITVFYKKVI